MLSVYSPYDRSLVDTCPITESGEIEGALETARNLFTQRSRWIPAHERIAILNLVAQIMEDRIEVLTTTAIREGGKPYVDSRIEVVRAINGVRLAAEYIGQLAGDQIPMGLTPSAEHRWAFTTREPIGVVASISAFNHPLNLIVHQTVTALASGCPVLIKPARTTPLSCLAFVQILREAGLPGEWCQPIICDNVLAEQMVTDRRVKYFSFIGSSKVGWYLRSKLAQGTRCALEHGGAAPVIVEADADLEKALPTLLKGGFYHAGQVCVSVQRVFVRDSICDGFAENLANRADRLIVGDPLEVETQVGPLIRPEEVDRVEEWVQEAVEGGAKLLCGGRRLSDTFYAPTVLLNPPPEAKVSTREIFGPVVCVYSFADRDKAIERANALDMHFQAAVFTQDLDIAMDSVRKLNASAVMVNDHTAFRVDWMPFGGRDVSGIGLGGIPYTMREMTHEKLMVIKSDAL